MPKEEGKNQPDTESHEPRDEKEGCALEVFELLQYGHPFRDLSRRLSEHFRLEQYEARLKCIIVPRDRHHQPFALQKHVNISFHQSGN